MSLKTAQNGHWHTSLLKQLNYLLLFSSFGRCNKKNDFTIRRPVKFFNLHVGKVKVKIHISIAS